MFRHRWKIAFAAMAMLAMCIVLTGPAFAQTPTPVPVPGARLLSDKDLENITKLLVVIGGFITVTLIPACVALYNLFKNGQAQNAAAAVIRIDQENRRLVSDGLEPVTMKSPATGTGDGRIDKMMETLLQQGPASAIAGAATGPVTLPTPPPNP